MRSEVCANGYKRDVLHPFLVGITFHRDTKSLEFGVVLYKLCQRASAHILLCLNLNRHHTIVVLHHKVDLGRSLGIAPIIRLDSITNSCCITYCSVKAPLNLVKALSPMSIWSAGASVIQANKPQSSRNSLKASISS